MALAIVTEGFLAFPLSLRESIFMLSRLEYGRLLPDLFRVSVISFPNRDSMYPERLRALSDKETEAL